MPSLSGLPLVHVTIYGSIDSTSPYFTTRLQMEPILALDFHTCFSSFIQICVPSAQTKPMFLGKFALLFHLLSSFSLYGFKISPMAYQLQYYQSQTVAQGVPQVMSQDTNQGQNAGNQNE